MPAKVDPDTGLPMRRVTITDAAYQAVQERATRYGMRIVGPNQGERQPDGTWAIDLDDEVLDVIMAYMGPGETASDVILRMCNAGGPPRRS